MNNKLMLEIADNLRSLANSIEAFAKGTHISTEDVVSVAIEPEDTVTLEQVRAALAEKSQSGKQPQVKELIQKHGANKLTALDPSCYAELLREAEEL